MSKELIGNIITAIAIVAILVPGQWALRREIAAVSARMGKVELGVIGRIGKLETALGERISKVDGFGLEPFSSRRQER